MNRFVNDLTFFKERCKTDDFSDSKSWEPK